MSRILILDDEAGTLSCFRALLTQAQRCEVEVEVLGDGSKVFELLAARDFDLILLGMDMPVASGLEVLRHVRQHRPGTEVVVITGVGDVELAVEAMKLGAYDYLSKPVAANQLVTCVDRALDELRRLRDPVDQQEGRVKDALEDAFKEFVTQDEGLLRALAEVEQIAHGDDNVLIWGESGTGKELLARAIHRIGCRADEPFMAVNAAAFATALFESRFRGHDRGAPDAADAAQPEAPVQAGGGTLFLDEIGEMELCAQSKLLRVLQGGERFRVGGTTRRITDVRIIAATHQDLEDEVKEGRFRRDLHKRLDMTSIFIPPLRERRADVEPLARHFLDKYCRANAKKISSIGAPVLQLLQAHDFPGNVRELENVIASAVVLETSDVLGLNALRVRRTRSTCAQKLRPTMVFTMNAWSAALVTPPPSATFSSQAGSLPPAGAARSTTPKR
jgi:DNA-binding NtrC family response regulator